MSKGQPGSARARGLAGAVLLSLLTAPAVASAATATGPVLGQRECREQAPGAPDCRPLLLVDDREGVGSTENGLLSLAEAIRLANGTLSLERLDAAERSQVSGIPGRTSGDTVRVVVPTVTLPAQEPPAVTTFSTPSVVSALPTLLGNDGDRFDGAGTVLGNGPEGSPIGGLGLAVASSDVVVEGFVLRRFYNMFEVNAPDAGGVGNVTLRRNRLEDGGGFYVDGIAYDGARATVSGVSITDNTVLGPAEFGRTRPGTAFNIPFSVIADWDSDPAFDPLDARTARIEDVVIARNVVRGFSTGGSIMAAQSAQPASSAGVGELARITIEDNDSEVPPEAVDPGFMVWGINTTLGDESGAVVEDVRVRRNRFAGGTAPFYAAATEVVFGTGSLSDVRWDGLEFQGNRVENAPNCGIGAFITGAFQELGGGVVRDVTFADVQVAGNRIVGCDTGVAVSPALFLLGAGVTNGVSMQDAEVVGNEISGGTHGVLVAGAAVAPSPLAPGTALPGAVAAGNTFDGVLLQGNAITTSGQGLRLFGGHVEGTGPVASTASGNSLTGVTVAPNRIVAPVACTAVADSNQSVGGVAVANTLEATCPGATVPAVLR